MRLEYFDDVEFEQDKDLVKLIQLKHSLKSNKSLDNYSSDLWKTLRIWSELFVKGEIVAGKTQLVLVTTASAVEDSVASLLRPSNMEGRDVIRALSKLRTIATSSRNKDNKPLYDAFMKLEESDQLILLQHVIVLDRSPTIRDVIRELERELRIVVIDRFVQDLLRDLHGWWLEKIISHLSSGQPSIIRFEDIRNYIVKLEQRYRDDSLRIDYYDDNVIPNDVLALDDRMFIRQLRLVEAHTHRMTRAAKDFYKASTQRSKWVAADPTVAKELSEYDGNLKERWEIHFDIMREKLESINNPQELIQKGREFYGIFETMDIPVRPNLTESSFITRGSYHKLADELKIGWHIDYMSALKPSGDVSA